MHIKKMIDDYLVFSMHIKREATVKYERDLFGRLIHAFDVLEIHRSEQMDTMMIRQIVMYFKKCTQCNARSINKHLRLLKQLFKFHALKTIELYEFPYLRETKKRFDILTKKEQLVLFENLDRMKSKGNLENYRMMIYLAWDTGLRQSELLHLRMKDVSIEERCIYVNPSKTCYDRYVFMSTRIATMLKDFMASMSDREYLFFNELRGRLFNNSDMKLFYRRMRKITGLEKLHTHMFRHTLATELVERGCNLSVVQKQLGHRSIKTTEMYVHLSLRIQKEEFDKIER